MSADPQELFDRFRRNALTGGLALTEDMCAESLVVEMPFAAEDTRRIEGRAAFLAFAQAGRERLPVTFDEFRNVVIHQTADPEVAVVEYEIAATSKTTGAQASSAFVVVMRVRDGRITHWREYQNPATMAELSAGP